MVKETKNTLLSFLELEIEKARENAEKTDEASKFVMSGPSQSGDKYHAENAASLAQAYVGRLEKLKKEIGEAKEASTDIAKPVCFLKVEYDDGSKLEFYLVENAVSLTKFLFISKNSPLGSSVFGKREGDVFSYGFEEDGEKREFSGTIVKVE